MANFLLMIPLLHQAEGGLNKELWDNAASDPVPDGSGYHTNKGIAWTTFKKMAATCGYTATPALFYEMPTSLWNCIFKKGYWDIAQGDKINSQGIAQFVADALFNGGAKSQIRAVQSFLNARGYSLAADGVMGSKTATAINSFIADNPKGEQDILDLWYSSRLSFYKNQEDWSQAKGGWVSRIDELYQSSMSYLGQFVVAATETVKKKPFLTASIIGLSFLGIGYFIMRSRK